MPLYDFGQEGNDPYLVMQLMKGGSLAEKVEAGALQMSEIVRILGELAPALDDMHKQKIIHRDLKPANILFDRWDNPYISDFGLAKLTEKAASFSVHGMKGAPAYMSPEQVRGHTLDGRCDIYSLGCIFYQMLTGKPPYHQKGGYGPLFSHVTEPPPRLSPLRTDLSPAWQALIDRVMAKTPAERPATASQFVNELKKLAEPAQKRLGIGSERVCPKDGMVQVYVPAGKFLMGCRDDNPDANHYEKPQHEVYLDAYWIDKTPVTNAMFAKFVQETGYYAEGVWKLKAGQWHENHPVVYISWNDANAYAKWTGRRLPTEAEWEKAAVGTDGRKWPWGNEKPTDKLCNFNGNVGDTTPVGSYPAGASPYRALDMSGNVREWCHDNFEENYYAFSPKANPQGPPKYSKYKILRGDCSWCLNTVNCVRKRGPAYPYTAEDDRGIRCAQSAS